MEVKAALPDPSVRERKIVGRIVRTIFSRDRRGGPWEVPSHLTYEAIQFAGNNRAALSGRWFPAAAPRGAVVLAHPDRRYGQHWFVKTGWIDFLHAAGFDVLTFDFAGYGESQGGSTYYHEDLEAAARFARRWSGGFPVHVIGLSMGAFVVANAAPKLDFVESLVLESPYPSFNAWYDRGFGRVAMEAFDRAFPRSAALIQADANIKRATAARILVAAPTNDAITPVHLSRVIAEASPAARTQYLELPDIAHLAPFTESAEYRRAVLATLGVEDAATRDVAIPAAGDDAREEMAASVPMPAAGRAQARSST